MLLLESFEKLRRPGAANAGEPVSLECLWGVEFPRSFSRLSHLYKPIPYDCAPLVDQEYLCAGGRDHLPFVTGKG